MATTGKINGTDLIVYVGGTAITHSTDCSVSLSMATRPASTKDSEGWAESLEGARNWTMSSDSMVALDAAYGLDDLFTLVRNRTSVTVKFATSDATDKFFSGTAWVTDISVTAGQEDTATYSASFEGTGRLTYSLT